MLWPQAGQQGGELALDAAVGKMDCVRRKVKSDGVVCFSFP